ncbi:MAG: hypothetical protein SXV54_20180 [Chloroflexota bacterium]|nr:hypothetical protein [Chloroflexota bacterium]
MNEHQVDILHIAGDESERALVVNGVLVDVCPADGAGTRIQDVAAFFANLGQAVEAPFVVTEHVVDVERLGLPVDDWTWPEVVARFREQASADRQAPDDKPEADLEAIAARIIARHGDDWEDGYTASGADDVLQAINDLVQAAGLPGLVMLVWETADAWGPCGSSDLYYVTPDGRILSASAAYSLANGERDPRPFLALLDEIRRGVAEFVSLPGFPAIQVAGSEYQGIDARGPW